MNPALLQLPASYLFSEIERRVKASGLTPINLGVGDTQGPLVPHVAERLERAARELGTSNGYRGYGPATGDLPLREAIAERLCDGQVSADEVFISDGAKCDLARLQHLFAPGSRAAIVQPTYPVYAEASLIAGHEPVLLDQLPMSYPEADLLYLCSPNNPTGQTFDIAPLLEGGPIIFDSAYAAFADQPSPFHHPGARRTVIETGSFSKLAGFTGVRLGYTVVCRENPLHDAWRRIVSTLFNGASVIAQAGGLAALEPTGWSQIQRQIAQIREGAAQLASALQVPCQAPYLWVGMPGQDSWELFDHYLHEYGIVTTPGVGFGEPGEVHLRFSAFAKPTDIERACQILTG